MRHYEWLSVGGVGVGTVLCINGHPLMGLLVGTFFMGYWLLKYRYYINEWMLIVSLLTSLLYIVMCIYTQLLSVLPVLFWMSIINGINTGLFMEVIRHKRPKAFNRVMKTLDIYACCLIFFMIIILMIPAFILNMFLYPHYVMGGAQAAMGVLVMIIFSPYIVIAKILSLYRYAQALMKHLVLRRNMVQ